MPKVGRNDLCPCGSQKKYKRCCLEEDRKNNVIRVSFSQPQSDLLSLIEEEMIWASDEYKVIAQHLVDHLLTQYGFEATVSAVLLWNTYTTNARPIIRKEAVCLAAMEYGVAQMQEKLEITQVLLAKKYGVSSAAISQRVHMIFNESFLQDDSPPLVIDKASKEHATELLYDAWAETNPKRKMQLVTRALELDPNNPDIYNISAETRAQSIEEAMEFYKAGMHVGERSLGASFFAVNAGHFWGLIETRPYMRSKKGYADCLWKARKTKQAIQELEYLLFLNPNDNQDARSVLLAAYFEERHYQKASELMNDYHEDHNSHHAYNRILLEYVQNGVSNRLVPICKEAQRKNRFVLDYLLGIKQIPDQPPENYSFGDRNEAIFYVQDYIHIWQRELKLMRWLKEHLQSK